MLLPACIVPMLPGDEINSVMQKKTKRQLPETAAGVFRLRECGNCDRRSKKLNASKINKAHDDIEMVFRKILPAHHLAVREEQIALCHDMYYSMTNRRMALCEAGVGIGKTFSYLVAGALLRKYHPIDTIISEHYGNDRLLPIIVSTSSIALQKAIVTEYIPFLSGVLLPEGIIENPLEASIRKGKSHYLCDERYRQRLRTANLIKKNPLQKAALLTFRKEIDLDCVSNLSGYDRRNICVPAICMKNCGFAECRYKRYIRKSKTENIYFQVTNHNYLIADAIHRQKKYEPLLPDYRAIVIDEAHRLPDAARQMFGRTIRPESLIELVQDIHKQRYYLAAERLWEVFELIIADIKETSTSMIGRNTEFFDLSDKRKSLYISAVLEIERLKRTVYDELDSATKRKVCSIQESLRIFAEEDNSYIYYKELDNSNHMSLMAAEKSIEDKMFRILWDRPIPTVLTSGTLAIGNDFSRFKDITGLWPIAKKIDESVKSSPFDYKRNCLLYIPNDSPIPSEFGEVKYYFALATQIAEIIKATYGHTLVLFTSYMMMSAVYDFLKKQEVQGSLLVAWRNDLKTFERFRIDQNGILLASGPVWEGIDFPGDVVSSLIIPRLPFPVPDPISEYEQTKYNTLRDFIRNVSVPDMQKKLKQGFGRAIRTETDSCVISILDDRAAYGARYYQTVLNALPQMVITDKLVDVRGFILKTKSENYFPNEKSDHDSYDI